jgi:hypothetical protein
MGIPDFTQDVNALYWTEPSYKGLSYVSDWDFESHAINRNVAGSIPNEVIAFFKWPNPSSRSMALVSTQPLTEKSTRNLPAGKGRPARKADNLTAICEPIV